MKRMFACWLVLTCIGFSAAAETGRLSRTVGFQRLTIAGGEQLPIGVSLVPIDGRHDGIDLGEILTADLPDGTVARWWDTSQQAWGEQVYDSPTGTWLGDHTYRHGEGVMLDLGGEDEVACDLVLAGQVASRFDGWTVRDGLNLIAYPYPVSCQADDSGLNQIARFGDALWRWTCRGRRPSWRRARFTPAGWRPNTALRGGAGYFLSKKNGDPVDGQPVRAVIVAARASAGDSMWPATDCIARRMYLTLRYLGFSRAQIRYLSHEPHRDIDGNGILDDIDAETLHANVEETITSWASGATRLFVFLADHGTPGYFRLGPGETLSATELAGWLNTHQTETESEVAVVMDACYSGSFLPPLAWNGPGERVVITSCAADEVAYFIGGGAMGFSGAFTMGLLLGLDLEESFLLGKDSMALYQNAKLDDNGDGVHEPETDGPRAAAIHVDTGFGGFADLPCVTRVSDNQRTAGGTGVTLWADEIASKRRIDRAWCVLSDVDTRPDPLNPLDDAVVLELYRNRRTGRYETTYDGFDAEKTYRTAIYVRDVFGRVSLPQERYVTRSSPVEKAIVVAGGEADDANRAGIDRAAALLYHALRNRFFNNESIVYLNVDPNKDLDGDGVTDVDAPPTLAALAEAVSAAGGTADDLTVYLVGETEGSAFRLSAAESLDATVLDGWLDTFQESGSDVCLVMDFSGAGAWLPLVIPPNGRDRISISSAQAGKAALMNDNGLESFTRHFSAALLDSTSIMSAFSEARTAIQRLSGRKRVIPMLDDTGDGVGNQTGVDGYLASARQIGTTFIAECARPRITALNMGEEQSFDMTWAAIPGRQYRVLATDDLAHGNWAVAAGPWTTASGQNTMQWSDTAAAAAAEKYYRIELLPGACHHP